MCTRGGEADVTGLNCATPLVYWRLMLSSSKRREDPRPSPSGKGIGRKKQRDLARSGAWQADAGTPPVVSDTYGLGEGCTGLGETQGCIPESAPSSATRRLCKVRRGALEMRPRVVPPSISFHFGFITNGFLLEFCFRLRIFALGDPMARKNQLAPC